jgi:hypothetical protein
MTGFPKNDNISTRGRRHFKKTSKNMESICLVIILISLKNDAFNIKWIPGTAWSGFELQVEETTSRHEEWL